MRNFELHTIPISLKFSNDFTWPTGILPVEGQSADQASAALCFTYLWVRHTDPPSRKEDAETIEPYCAPGLAVNPFLGEEEEEELQN